MGQIQLNPGIIVGTIGSCIVMCIILFEMLGSDNRHNAIVKKLHLKQIKNLPEATVELSSPAKKTDLNCKMYSCFNIYRCGTTVEHRTKLSIYLYPLHRYKDQNGNFINTAFSREFVELYYTILESEFYTDNPENACILIPPIDLLNQMSIQDIDQTSRLLATFFHQNNGLNNHLIFNMIPGVYPTFSTAFEVNHGKAILAGGGFSIWTYRALYDVSIPVFSAASQELIDVDWEHRFRPWFLVSSQPNIHSEFRSVLKTIERSEIDFLLLEKCRHLPEELPVLTRCHGPEHRVDYPEILLQGKFCLVLPTTRLGQTVLSDAMSAGCIPVIVSDTYILPFSEVLDWPQASVIIKEENLGNIYSVLRSLSPEAVAMKSAFARFYYERYFSSMSAITLTTLNIINGRVFTNRAKTYEEWNRIPSKNGIKPKLFLPLQSPKTDGFTLCY